ncbi:hypothetical protein NYZ99_18170 [Maribacter litopenaei]|uniref:Uncharacterized protein n=1 Tax=Maribacter litopenaei TaxID=2976127 RepID=A0ABY5Y7A4_9FLAO|nr:hypothetical protein [Maribacter litopenaei]UWX54726.1 hypothetical protein NYZ99_18170 [Maribacter litopenaei]
MLNGMNKADIKTEKDVLIVGSVGEEGRGGFKRDEVHFQRIRYENRFLDSDRWR